MPRQYNTPHRDRIIKTRMTQEEYDEFSDMVSTLGMNQSEFIRTAIRRAPVRPIIKASLINDAWVAAIGKLVGEYGKIGSNLNQIAKHLNEFGTPYNALAAEVRAAIADLAALKYEVLKEVGNAVGYDQTYRL